MSTGVGCQALLQGIFPTQGSNPGLSPCRQLLYHLIHQESTETIANQLLADSYQNSISVWQVTSCTWWQALSQNPTLFPAGAWSLIPAFKRIWALLTNHKRPCKWEEWVRDPFVNKPGESALSMLEKDQLLEIGNDDGLKRMFETTSNLHTFCIKISMEYPETVTKAMKSMLPFSTPCFLKQDFLQWQQPKWDYGVDWT